MHIKTLFLALFLLVLSLLPSCTGKVEYLGIFGESRKKEVLGQDGVTPIPISKSKILWTFGDTILGTWKGNVSVSATFSEKVNMDTMISNSMAFTNMPADADIKSLDFVFYKEKGKVAQFIKYKKGENPRFTRLWALDGIRINNIVYVYYLIIKIAQSGKPLDFKLHAVGLSAWHMQKDWNINDRVDFVRLKNIFPDNYPAFGASVIRRDDFLYSIGQFSRKDFSSPVKITRVKIDQLENPGAYQFLSDNGSWAGDINKARSFLNDVMGECSLSFNEKLQKFIIIYCQRWTGNIIMVAFKDFKSLISAEKETIFHMPDLPKKDGDAWYYSGKEIFASKNIIYAICINPLEYQPYLLKIKL